MLCTCIQCLKSTFCVQDKVAKLYHFAVQQSLAHSGVHVRRKSGERERQNEDVWEVGRERERERVRKTNNREDELERLLLKSQRENEDLGQKYVAVSEKVSVRSKPDQCGQFTLIIEDLNRKTPLVTILPKT